MFYISPQKYGKFTHNFITAHKNGRFMRFANLISSHILLHAFPILYRVYLRKRKEHGHTILK